jgi:hypothetical protein
LTILKDSNEDDNSIQIFTDGSRTEQGVGAGAAIFILVTGKHTMSLKYRLYKRCTNNQLEQVAILKSLEYIKVYTQQERRSPYAQTARRHWTPSKTPVSTHPL